MCGAITSQLELAREQLVSPTSERKQQQPDTTLLCMRAPCALAEQAALSGRISSMVDRLASCGLPPVTAGTSPLRHHGLSHPAPKLKVQIRRARSCGVLAALLLPSSRASKLQKEGPGGGSKNHKTHTQIYGQMMAKAWENANCGALAVSPSF
ncbi:hypothetical protein SETIT_1G198700v2 [Setaria italica]|uniref:Uncharacterized protein n=1 Tax=Setaria italica TaxID=4555 RepID=A0A368PM77_SETIT|nr:hypothetical protein SETIT_1G198700v2 [Setaria italica]